MAVTMDVGDASKINYPGYLVIDRVDAAGTLKATSLWEYVKVTNIATNTLTITRGQGGSTAQAHSSGAVVESVMTAALQEEYYDVVNPEHTAAGLHVIGTATVNKVETKNLSASSVSSISLPFASVFNKNIKFDEIQTATIIPASVASTATTGTTDLGSLSVTFTPSTVSNCLVLFNANVYNTADKSSVGFVLDVDGSDTTMGTSQLQTATDYSMTSWQTFKSGITVAAHTFKAQWSSSATSAVVCNRGELIVIPFAS